MGSGVRFANTTVKNAASTVVTVESPNAPTTYRFAMTLPPGATLVSDGGGGYDLVRADGLAAASFAHLDAPWAHDARGRSLPTAFFLDGSTLVQTVGTRGATFPVTADPHYTWGWVTGTIYFNKHETAIFAVAATAASFIASLAGPWSVLLRGYVTYLQVAAGKAIADHKCLKVKSTLTAGEYSGGYCS
jgi:hypothetical protein